VSGAVQGRPTRPDDVTGMYRQGDRKEPECVLTNYATLAIKPRAQIAIAPILVVLDSDGLERNSSMDRADMTRQIGVGARPSRSWSAPQGVIARGRSLQDAGHCTNGIHGLVRAHEPVKPVRARLALPRKPGCRLCQDVALLTQAMVLTAKTRQLFSVGAGWSLGAPAGVPLGLLQSLCGGRARNARDAVPLRPTEWATAHSTCPLRLWLTPRRACRLTAQGDENAELRNEPRSSPASSSERDERADPR
jgi:hypothetical protein